MRYGVYYQFIGKREGFWDIFATNGGISGRIWGDLWRFEMSCDELWWVDANSKQWGGVIYEGRDMLWYLREWVTTNFKGGNWIEGAFLTTWDQFVLIGVDFGALEGDVRHSVMSQNEWKGDFLMSGGHFAMICISLARFRDNLRRLGIFRDVWRWSWVTGDE